MASAFYSKNVFINCPFDDNYKPIFHAIVFAIYDCGFIPRCALEEDNGGDIRFEKIKRIIADCKYGIHDISRTELDENSKLPRFNMPLELGVFLGAKHFGDRNQKTKNILILDREKYRYQAFLSDVSGQDIRSHGLIPRAAISHIRNWLNIASKVTTIPGGSVISKRYEQFLEDLPTICKNAGLEPNEVEFNDFSDFVSIWLKKIGDFKHRKSRR